MFDSLFSTIAKLVLRLLRGSTPPPPAPAQDAIDARVDEALAQKRLDDAERAAAEDVYDAAAVELEAERAAVPAPPPEPPPVTLAVALVEAAREDLGTVEDGANDGTRVREMLSGVGVDVPAAWCAAALTTWLRAACTRLGVRMPIAGSASAIAIQGQLVQARRWVGRRELAGRIGPGWVVVWHRGAPGSWMGHVGVVEAVEGDVLTCIEGNSGQVSDRVARMTRSLTDPNLLGAGWVD